MFPRIIKCFGYRWTFRLAVLVFTAACVLLPFSNQITGPVPVPESLNDTFSGSGSGSGLQNSTDYCGNDLSSTSVSVNENSVKRIPVYIWAVVIGILVFSAISKCAQHTHTLTHTTYIHAQAHTCIHAHTHAHAQMHTHTHALKCTYPPTHAHTLAHTYTHTHTHTQNGISYQYYDSDKQFNTCKPSPYYELQKNLADYEVRILSLACN